MYYYGTPKVWRAESMARRFRNAKKKKKIEKKNTPPPSSGQILNYPPKFFSS
jgi:hypothetical protein